MNEAVGIIRLYPKTDEQKDHFRMHGVPDSEGRFYRTGLDFRKRGTAKRKILADAIETLSRYEIGSFYDGGDILITKIAEDELEVKGNLNKRNLPKGIKFRISNNEQE